MLLFRMSRQQRRALARQQVRQQLKSAPSHGGGPKTPEGKAVSSQNALSHRLTSAKLVLPWENQVEFDALLDGLLDEHRPVTITEQIMVKEMAEQYWRLIRARNKEHLFYSHCPEHDAAPDEFARWEKALLLAQRYARTHERAFHKCLATLRTLQKERRALEAETEAESREISEAEPGSVSEPRTHSEFVSQKISEPPPATVSDPRLPAAA